MCGRLAQTLPPEIAHRYFRTAGKTPQHAPSWNVAPTQKAMIVRRAADGSRQLDALRWGLVPRWARDLAFGNRTINARGEGVAEKPAFRDAWRRRRCVLPADAFYEWQKLATGKQPHAIARADGEPLIFGALWESWTSLEGEVIETFAIVTIAANEMMQPIHDRMPVILAPDEVALWLGESDGDPASLLRPCPSAWLTSWPISRRVNTPANNDARVLDPLPAASTVPEG